MSKGGPSVGHRDLNADSCPTRFGGHLLPYVPAFLPKFIGLSELAGGLGFILPAVTRTMPKLTPIAAALPVVVMTLAALTHVLYADFGHMPRALSSLHSARSSPGDAASRCQSLHADWCSADWVLRVV